MRKYYMLGVMLLVAFTGRVSTPHPAKPANGWADWAAINTCISVAEIGIVISKEDLNPVVRDRSATLLNLYTSLGQRLAPLMGISERDRLEIIAEEIELRRIPDWNGTPNEAYGRARSTLMVDQLKCEADAAVYQSRPWA